MLDWFRTKPTCPVNTDDRDWIEERFSWLTNELGRERLRKGTLILPTTDYFPAVYPCSEEEIVDLMSLVAAYMDVDPASLRLNFYRDAT